MSGPNESRPTKRVAIVGVGALGCVVLRSLSERKNILITIIDGDRVEASNLDRQCLFTAEDVGKMKVAAAHTWMNAGGEGVRVDAHGVFLHAGNAEALLSGVQVVLDCTDDLHAKDLIDRTCNALGIALLSGGLHAAEGQVLALHVEGDGSTLQRADLFGGRAGAEQDGCDMRLVPTTVVDAVADRMAQLLKDILEERPVVNGELALYGGSGWSTFSTNVPA